MKFYTIILMSMILYLFGGNALAAFPVREVTGPQMSDIQGKTLAVAVQPVNAKSYVPAGVSSDGTIGIVSLAIGISGWAIILLAGAASVFGLLGVACAWSYCDRYYWSKQA